jgi:glycine/D-amino acid oxidase-like deaminating enzyme
MRIDDVEGGIWEPRDGTISAMNLLNTFADESRKQGIKIIENCEVQKVLVKTTRGGHYFKVKGVETSLGVIECDIFVNCAGIVKNCLFWLKKNFFF